MPSFVAPLQGHLNMALTTYVKGFRQHPLVSDIIFPRVPVERQQDAYNILDVSGQQLTEQTLRAPGAEAQAIRMATSQDTYKAESHALQAPLPDENKVNAEQAGLGRLVSTQGRTRILQAKILLDKEQRAADLLTTSNITNNVTLAGADKWTDKLNSDPAGVIETARAAIRLSGVEADTLILGSSVAVALRQHPAIIERFKYVQKGLLGVPELSSFFDIPNIVVAKAVKASNAATPVKGYVIDPEDALLFYSGADAQADEDLSFGKTFVWSQAPGTVGGYGVIIGRVPGVTAKSETVGVDFYYDQKITATETGYLIKDAA